VGPSQNSKVLFYYTGDSITRKEKWIKEKQAL
jgi:hypothetical protein